MLVEVVGELIKVEHRERVVLVEEELVLSVVQLRQVQLILVEVAVVMLMVLHQEQEVQA
jgi:hypothetical protein